MLQQIDLRALAEHHGPERAFVSVFVSGPDGRASLQRREDRIRAMLEDEPIELEHFTESIAMARGWLDENPQKGAGQAVFASWAESFLQGFDLDAPAGDLMRVGPAPYLRPLAELQDEFETFVVVAASNRKTRVLTVSADVSDEAGRVRGDVRHRSHKGGWSQKRYERRRDEQLGHYADDIVTALAELGKEQPFRRIALLGTREILLELKEAMPKELADKVIGMRGVDLHEGNDVLLDSAFELFFEEERDEEEQLWDRIRDEYLGDGLAVVGAEDVLTAVTVGRVERMLVDREAKLKGAACRDCSNLHASRIVACRFCGSGSVFDVDLVDTLVRQLELTSGSVEFSDPIPGLTRVGQVGALLRW